MTDPEDDDCGDLDCLDESVGVAVEAHGDISSVFKFCEHVFDFVPLFIQVLTVGCAMFAFGSRRDAGSNAAINQHCTISIAI